jgi:hypothetical protein
MDDQGALFPPDPPKPDNRLPWQRSGSWNLAEGKQLRDKGIAQVSANTPEEYRRLFACMVIDFRDLRRNFTSEDVTARIGFPPGTHPNAIGALTRSMAMRYGARKVGRTKAQRSNQHATEIAVWGW